MINSFETLFEARERKFQQERLFRGESVDLVARITTDGVLDDLSDYTISGVYQPVGDDPEGLTYTVDSEIRDGKAILHWTNDNDFGKTAYNVWGLLMKDGKGAYPIAWRLNFASSPSYPIDEINPLVRTIDFDNYDLLNAPWLPLSGGVMDQDATIAFPVSEDARIKVGKDGFQAVDVTTVETEAMSGWCWHELPDPVPDYEIQWVTESEIANWDPSTQGTPPWLNPRFRLCNTKPASTETTETETAKYQIPTDEEGDRTFATREWTQEKAIDKLDDYLPLSGGTVSGDFAVENFLSSTDRGVFLGKNQDLNQYAELAIGNNLSVGMVGLAIGSNSEAQNNGITIGHNAKSPYGGGNIVIGNGASTASNGTTVVGTNAKASGGNAIAIGSSANATQSGEVRLGGPQGNLQPQLWLFETPIISGPDTSILPERIPYLSAYAKTEDLADYATQEWVNEHIDQLSDVYVKKDNIDFLCTDFAGQPDMNQVSLFDIAHRLNFCIRAISGKEIPHGDSPSDTQYTYIVMADGTELDIGAEELDSIDEGTLDALVKSKGYSGSDDIRAVVLGEGITHIGHHSFAGFANLEMVDISRAQITFVEDRTFQYSPMLSYVDLGTSISAIGNTVFQHSYRLTELTLPESLVTASVWSFNNGGIEKLIFSNRTKAQVEAMANYPWQMGGCTMVATDETWIA